MAIKQHPHLVGYFLLELFIAIALITQAATQYVPRHGRCIQQDQYQCLHSTSCFPKQFECDLRNFCSDGSDESHCQFSKGPCAIGYFQCNCGHCLKVDVLCNGVIDCFDGEDEDEEDCGDSMGARGGFIGISSRFNGNSWRSMITAKNELLNSALTAASSQKKESKANVWGMEPHRVSVSLYMSNISIDENSWRELRYETSNRLLSRMSKRSLKDIYLSDLALYVNAFLVLCINPRDFYSTDLVSELRQRSRESQYVDPLVTLARCNAHDTITEVDVAKLVDVVENPKTNSWIDSQALSIMALACAVKQESFDQAQLDDLTFEIKKKQFRNGTVDNIKTTALVLQALFASQSEPDEDNFDEMKAIAQILRAQHSDGSFGSAVDDYYIMPVLSARSLVNISDSHCKKARKDPLEAWHKVVHFSGARKSVHYSIWIGDEISVERDLKLKVPVNTSLYAVLELAGEIDAAFKCKYNVRDQKPFIYQIANLQDDPERETFWFLYSNASNAKNAVLLTESPANVMPKDKDHFAIWYRRGQWHTEDNKTSGENAERD